METNSTIVVNPLMAGGEPDLTALSMDSQTDQLKVQTIKSKQLSARHKGSVVSKTFVYIFWLYTKSC